jgi:hypothetical protein
MDIFNSLVNVQWTLNGRQFNMVIVHNVTKDYKGYKDYKVKSRITTVMSDQNTLNKIDK